MDRGYIPVVNSGEHLIRIRSPGRPLDEEAIRSLRAALSVCPDLAFAHLVDCEVEGVSGERNLSLFVWLMPEGVKSLRGSLNLVSEVVAGAIPQDRCVDILILNSAPELLADVEHAGCLFVERDPVERSRAIAALQAGDHPGTP